VEQAVADRIGERRISDEVVPLGDRQLAGQDGRMGAVPIVEQLEEVAAILRAEGIEPPVVNLCGAQHKSYVELNINRLMVSGQ
jgi:hypothetical protein